MHRVLERQLRRLGLARETPPTAEQWQLLLDRIDRAYVEADQDRYTVERSLELSSAEMRKRFNALREAQDQLVLTSRKAGMADVATSVLHNVGNALNSLNVSTHVLVDALRSSMRGGLTKTLALLQNQPTPGRFLDEDPRGKKVLAYLAAVDAALTREREEMLRELASLSKNLEHVNVIVSRQLDAARATKTLDDTVTLDEVLAAAAAAAHGPNVAVEREPTALVVRTDRHKLLQILLNLTTNARDAVLARGDGGTVKLRATGTGGALRIEVSDDGVGIAPDHLPRIFTHGFTTKASGHGFGLHSAACAAMELGGALTAESPGAGRGSTFTLTLPSRRGSREVEAPVNA